MNTREFNGMDDVRQAETLLNEGVVIAERLYKEFRILLYQVRHFYVEVYFHKKFDMIQGFRSFESMSSLDPYLEEIDISDLAFC